MAIVMAGQDRLSAVVTPIGSLDAQIATLTEKIRLLSLVIPRISSVIASDVHGLVEPAIHTKLFFHNDRLSEDLKFAKLKLHDLLLLRKATASSSKKPSPSVRGTILRTVFQDEKGLPRTGPVRLNSDHTTGMIGLWR